MLTHGRLETLWHLVSADKLRFENGSALARRRPAAWWEAVTTNADTFQRIAEPSESAMDRIEREP